MHPCNYKTVSMCQSLMTNMWAGLWSEGRGLWPGRPDHITTSELLTWLWIESTLCINYTKHSLTFRVLWKILLSPKQPSTVNAVSHRCQVWVEADASVYFGNVTLVTDICCSHVRDMLCHELKIKQQILSHVWCLVTSRRGQQTVDPVLFSTVGDVCPTAKASVIGCKHYVCLNVWALQWWKDHKQQHIVCS